MDLTLICPAFNEADAIAANIAKLRDWIDALPHSCEVILVDDGSRDDTAARALAAIDGDPRFRVLQHKRNFGRGRALRTGIGEATGEIIVTTEADLSWGTDCLQRMIVRLQEDPGVDAVFASTHLRGGGYLRVPSHRVFLSHFGNKLLSRLYAGGLTMTTGMTRAYRARAVQSHVFEEDGKEIHLEIAHRLLSLHYRVEETAALLSWPEAEAGKSRGKRTNWTKIFRLVGTHLAFGMTRGASRLIALGAALFTPLTLGLMTWTVANYLRGQTSVFLAILTGVSLVLWTQLTLSYLLIFHTARSCIESWKTQRMLCEQGRVLADRSYYREVTAAHPTVRIAKAA